MNLNLDELREFSISLAKASSKCNLRHFHKGIEVLRKVSGSPVTIADRETEVFLREKIHEKYPDHKILGEEYGLSGKDSIYKWVIDPIDGTKSFINNIPLYSTLISLLENGNPIMGLIHIPYMNKTAIALKDRGCYIDDVKASVSPINKLEDAFLVMTDPSKNLRITEFTEKLLKTVKMSRSWGDGHGYMMVAEGKANIMYDPSMGIWDVAPHKLIIEEAGGCFNDLSGKVHILENETDYNYNALATSNKELTEAILKLQ